MKNKSRLIITLVFISLLFTMSVGYAIYGARTTITGTSTFKYNGDVYISSAIITDYKNLQNVENPTVNGTTVSFNLNFFVPRTEEGLNDTYYATYQVTIENDSVFDYVFKASDFTPNINNQNQDMDVSFSVDGIELDEEIPSKSNKTFYFTINMVPNDAGNFNVSGEINVDLEEEEETGSILASIPRDSTGNLINNNVVPIDVTIINTFDENKNYEIVVLNDSFELVDLNGNSLTTYTINANSEDTKTVYIRIKSGARFASNNQNLNLFLSTPSNGNINIGLVRLTVPKDATLVDVTPPSISNLTATMQTTKGDVLLEYTASDDFSLNGFTIEVHKDGNLIDTKTAGPDVRSYTIHNLADGNYSFKVTAEDTSGLTSSASTTEKNYRWTMNVVINITQGGPNGSSTIDYGKNFTTTITANTGRTLPQNLTITMNGTALPNNSYTYNNNNGNLTINNVTGDLNISGQTGTVCLIKGTKVLLANNTYKNIEDIRYDDLLMVWNYETGTLTKEYPIWMEKEKVTNSYTNIEFSDGSNIGVVGAHAFFNGDYNEFVSVLDKNKFHIGSTILKVKNGKLKRVKVTKIERVNKTIEYYFVASTRYWNIITNDFVTTDGYTEISNLYKFDDNITWDKNRKIIKIDYKELKNVLPYYLFKGFRAEEVGVLIQKNQSDIESFKEYVKNLIISNHMLKEPIIKNNNRYWMVTTSIDKVKDKSKYLVKEGSYYKLPKGRWYSTSENIIYEGNSKVQVWTGMHFEKIV